MFISRFGRRSSFGGRNQLKPPLDHPFRLPSFQGAPFSRRATQTAAVVAKAFVIRRKIIAACRKLIICSRTIDTSSGFSHTEGSRSCEGKTCMTVRISSTEWAQEDANVHKETRAAAIAVDAPAT
jgi:hypothetical protein